MASVDLSVASRSDNGKGVARKLRADNQIPAVLYGHDMDGARPIAMQSMAFRKALMTRAGLRVILNLTVDGADKRVAIIRDVQRHPLSQDILHADLLAIDFTQPVEVDIPIHAIGTPIGVKTEGGVLGWAQRELMVRVLPSNIPESIEVDVTELHVGMSIHVSDLKTDGFEVLEDPEQTICSVASTKIEEEPVEAELAEGEVAEADAADTDEGKKPDGGE